MAIVQAGRGAGKIVVRADAAGLAGATVTLKAETVQARAFVL